MSLLGNGVAIAKTPAPTGMRQMLYKAVSRAMSLTPYHREVKKQIEEFKLAGEPKAAEWLEAVLEESNRAMVDKFLELFPVGNSKVTEEGG